MMLREILYMKVLYAKIWSKKYNFKIDEDMNALQSYMNQEDKKFATTLRDDEQHKLSERNI
jgi:hypothetical protein